MACHALGATSIGACHMAQFTLVILGLSDLTAFS